MKEVSVRTKKVASLLQRELAGILRSEINDPRVSGIGMITVSRIELAADHRNATVYVSFMGEKTKKPETKAAIDVLNGAARFIRGVLMKRVDLKAVPLLHFRYDVGFDHAARVSEAFQRIRHPRQEEE